MSIPVRIEETPLGKIKLAFSYGDVARGMAIRVACKANRFPRTAWDRIHRLSEYAPRKAAALAAGRGRVNERRASGRKAKFLAQIDNAVARPGLDEGMSAALTVDARRYRQRYELDIGPTSPDRPPDRPPTAPPPDNALQGTTGSATGQSGATDASPEDDGAEFGADIIRIEEL